MSRFEATSRDRDAWAGLWRIARLSWGRDEDLGRALGVTGACVGHWRRGDRAGPWAALRGALRRGAAAAPERVPDVAQRLIEELLDVRGTWHPAGTTDDDDDGVSIRDAFTDAVMAGSGLASALSGGADADNVIELTERFRACSDRLVRVALRQARRRAA